MVKLQILSDLHLEFGSQYQTYDIPVCAPYLIIAGDVGQLCDYKQYLEFLERQCKNFQSIFLVLGNHEFHGLSWDQTHEQALRLVEEPCLSGRLVLLDRTRIELPGRVILLGCTLWSHISSEAEVSVKARVKDFVHIKEWSVEEHNKKHQRDVQWLSREVLNIRTASPDTQNYLEKSQIIVVTHHAPVREGSSRPEQLLNPWTDAFATNLLNDDSIDKLDSNRTSNSLNTVDYWVFGHTHLTTKFQKGSVMLISNQRGYIDAQPFSIIQTHGARPDTDSTSNLVGKHTHGSHGLLTKHVEPGRTHSSKNQPLTNLKLKADLRDNDDIFDPRKTIEV